MRETKNLKGCQLKRRLRFVARFELPESLIQTCRDRPFEEQAYSQ